MSISFAVTKVMKYLLLILISLQTTSSMAISIEIWGPSLRDYIIRVVKEKGNSTISRHLCPSDLVNHPAFESEDLDSLFEKANDCVTDFSRPGESYLSPRKNDYPYEQTVNSYGELSIGQKVIYNSKVHMIAFLGSLGSIILKSHIIDRRGIGPNYLGYEIANPLTIDDLSEIEVDRFGEITAGKSVEVNTGVIFNNYNLIKVKAVFTSGIFEGHNGRLYKYENISNLNP